MLSPSLDLRPALTAILLSLLLTACSWRVPFYIVNNGDAPRRVEITFTKDRESFLIFHPRYFTFVRWHNDAPDYAVSRHAPQLWREEISIEIPAHTALEIGHLNNDRYEHAGQRFINARVFNLVRLRAGTVDVDRETFDKHFAKKADCVVWVLPQ